MELNIYIVNVLNPVQHINPVRCFLKTPPKPRLSQQLTLYHLKASLLQSRVPIFPEIFCPVIHCVPITLFFQQKAKNLWWFSHWKVLPIFSGLEKSMSHWRRLVLSFNLQQKVHLEYRKFPLEKRSFYRLTKTPLFRIYFCYWQHSYGRVGHHHKK